ncbi:hypothetical protein SO802_012442 [Lithocarpus litseifolius]|uniref:Uncharacterized protein n=1 Tax=Lithocarpus litseifolius TaxID=425828 RepID=A0AAW2D867_9ROSI
MGLFVSRECAFRPVLLEPYLLIRHSLIQHHLMSKVVEERVVGSKVRLSELDTRLSSSNDLLGIEVLRGSLHLTTDYLATEEKVVTANSRVKATEAESSRLWKDLIEAMD